jgi:hypothetical protein
MSAGCGVVLVLRTAGCVAAVTPTEATTSIMTAWAPKDAAMAQRFASRAGAAVMPHL